MTWGVKISQPTKEVITAGLSDLVLDSDYGVLKAKLVGSIVIASGSTGTIAHGLGYAPGFRVWCQGVTYRFATPRFYDGAVDPIGGGVQSLAYSDPTNLNIFATKSGGGNITVYYYIFVDPLQ